VKPVRLRRIAKLDLREAVVWYRERDPDLASRFLDEVYRTLLRRPGDVRHVAANTTGAAATIALPPGRMEWFVEALFPACPSMMSEAGVLNVPAVRRRAAK